MQDQTASIAPVAIRIPKALINTSIEPLQVAGGKPENPSSTWAVGWYEGFGPLRNAENTIFYGYPDFYGVGPAVFWFLGSLLEGDAIEVTGDDGLVYPYLVTSVTSYEQATAPIAEIFGDAGEEVLTLFSGAPPYDTQGNYLNLVVVRATPAGEPFALLAGTATGTGAIDCSLDPQALQINGETPAPVNVGPEARDLTNLASAVPASEDDIASIEAALQTATTCPIAVREALVLEDGRIITLVGQPGMIPLDDLVSPGGFDSLSTAPQARALAYILFTPGSDGWVIEGIPWYAGS